MKGLIFLSGEAPDLALAEVNGALKAMGKYPGAHSPDLQVALIENEPPAGLAERLGFSHFTGILDATCPVDMDNILDGIARTLSMVEKGHSISFQVKVPKGSAPFSSSELFDTIDKIARDRGHFVKHRDPDVKLFVIVRNSCYLGRLMQTSSRLSAEVRRGSKMPYNRPIVMDPRLARVLVNLSGLHPGNTVLDPFLGPAGLAIEAAHLGLNVIGVERDPEIFYGARVNVEYLDLSDNVTIKNGDSRKLRDYPWMKKVERIDGIITDPPFGRSATTGGEETGKLVNDVIEGVLDLIPVGAPLIIDSHTREPLSQVPGFQLRDTYEFRIHKSMTRYIGVLSRK